MRPRIIKYIATLSLLTALLLPNLNALTAPPTPSPLPAPTPTQFPSLQAGFDNDFRFLSQFPISGKIAFTATIDGVDRILSLNLEHKRIEKIIDGPGNNFYPKWSPNGKWITFVSDRDGNNEIYLADSGGGTIRRITNNTLDNDHPSWSADGKEILYFEQAGGNKKDPQGNIFIYNLANKNSRQITRFTYKNSTPQLSPDGRTLAYSTNRFWPGWDICFFDLRTKKEECPLSGTSTFCRPAWSHDGRFLAYSSGLFSDVDAAIYDVQEQKDIATWSTSGNDYDLAWSPDDKFIVFGSDVEKREVFDLYIYPLEDNAEHKFFPLLKSQYSLRYLSWVGSPASATPVPASDGSGSGGAP